MPDQILITGAGGQLGRAAREIRPDAHAFRREELDVTDAHRLKEVIHSVRPHIVLNAAAYTTVDKAEEEVKIAAEINVTGARNVAKLSAQVDAVSIYPSTNFVFSGGAGVYDEDAVPDPISAYGRTKAEGEAAVLSEDGTLVVRTSAVYGEGGENFLVQIIRAARDNLEVRVVDDQLCQPTHAKDLADAVLTLAEQGASGIFHVAGAGEAGTWADVAEHALAAAGCAARVVRVTTDEFYARRPGPIAPRPPRAVLDLRKADGAGVVMRPWREAVAEYSRSA